MTDRYTADTINDNALTALYEQLEAAEQTECHRQLVTAREAFASATLRAARAEAVLARAEQLRDKWLAYPVDDVHYGAGLMLACYLEPQPAPDTTATPAVEPASRQPAVAE